MTRRLFVATAALAGLALVAVAGELGDHWWLADLLAHQRFQYAAAGLVLAALFLIFRAPRRAAAAALVTSAHLAVVAGVATAPRAANGDGADADDRRLRVLTLNAQWSNPEAKAVAAFVAASGADIVALQEISPRLYPLVDRLLATYPHAAPADWRRRTPGIVVLGRRPFLAAREIPGGDLASPIVEVTVAAGGATARVVAVHAPYPVSDGLWRLHREYLAALASVVRAGDGPVIVIGDFNMTPWTPRFRRFARETGLAPAGDYLLWPRTWPAHARPLSYAPAWLAGGLPIDHALVGRGIAVAALRRGPYVHSDHYPVTVDLVLPPR